MFALSECYTASMLHEVTAILLAARIRAFVRTRKCDPILSSPEGVGIRMHVFSIICSYM